MKNYNTNNNCDVFFCYRHDNLETVNNFAITFDSLKKENFDCGNIWFSNREPLGNYVLDIKPLLESANYAILFLAKGFTDGFLKANGELNIEEGNNCKNDCVTVREFIEIERQRQKNGIKVFAVNIEGYTFSETELKTIKTVFEKANILTDTSIEFYQYLQQNPYYFASTNILSFIREKFAILNKNNLQNFTTNEDSSKTCEEISKEFLDDDPKKCLESKDNSYLKHCEKITKRLKCMANNTLEVKSDNYINELYEKIIAHTQQYPYFEKIFKIVGKTGTQKRYALQLLYVYLMKNYNNHLFEPLYIHCTDLKRNLLQKNHTRETTLSYINNLFARLHVPQERTLLFIIDGVLNVNIDDYGIDFAINSQVDNFFNKYIIVGVNDVFADNPERTNMCNLINDFPEMIEFSSISLYEKEHCKTYLSTLEGIDKCRLEEIFKKLTKTKLTTINAQIIAMISAALLSTAKDVDVMAIYESRISNTFGGNVDNIKLAAELVYNFSYSQEPLNYNEEIKEKALDLICEDRVYLNCFIAMHYINKVYDYSNTQDLSFFQKILPKEVTRFIVSKLNNNSILENIMLRIASRYYDDEMNDFGRSEMSFFLGRLKSNVPQTINLLENYYQKTKNDIVKNIIDQKYYNKVYVEARYKQDLFLLRGIAVSLIYRGKANVEIEYIRSLIENDLANSINRGFHLEYYGDIIYMPDANSLTYEDDTRKGEHTLRILFNSIRRKLESSYRVALLLDLFTVASLLQARIELSDKIPNFNIVPYIEEFLKVYEKCIDAESLADNIITSFFYMCAEDFSEFLNKKKQFSQKNTVCNIYSNAKNVLRTGWVEQNIPSPESIVEHMYSCWFVGLLFLPKDYPQDSSYDKQKILNMLLIHDLAETELEDIAKYEKPKYPDYNERENYKIMSLFLKGTYKNIDSMSDYVYAWDEWYEQKTLNAKIAKDIDVIQAIYQFLLYYLKHPNNFDEERKRLWLKEKNEVKTPIGRTILNELVFNNDLFKEIL
ncbi:MAG: HD domain-containing protein [Clostridia bacterium]|nr:HD domain-containing protein [Clostridia bacterium]